MQLTTRNKSISWNYKQLHVNHFEENESGNSKWLLEITRLLELNSIRWGCLVFFYGYAVMVSVRWSLTSCFIINRNMFMGIMETVEYPRLSYATGKSGTWFLFGLIFNKRSFLRIFFSRSEIFIKLIFQAAQFSSLNLFFKNQSFLLSFFLKKRSFH